MANTDITKNVAALAGKLFMPKVANATFYWNDMVAFTATANTSTDVNIETTQEQIKGGQNNAVLGVITSEKSINVSFSTPEWKIEFLAANIGEEIQIGNFAFEVSDLSLAASEGIITLPEVPVDGKIYVDVNGTYVTVDVSDVNVDLTGLGLEPDACVPVLGMFNKAGKRVNLSVDTDPLVGKLVLTSPIFRGTTGMAGTSQYVFPAFALSGNWSQTYGTDASYEISGQPIATSSNVCGEGQTYGYYQEAVDTDADVSYSTISASPSIVELVVGGDSETLTVYGAKSSLYAKSVITGATFATEDTGVITVNATTGEISPVAEGEGMVTVTYGNLITTVEVEVVSA